MNTSRILALILGLLLTGGVVSGQNSDSLWTVIVLENGIYKERSHPGNNSENRFTKDNQLYKQGRSFTFKYKFLKNGEVFFFKPKVNGDGNQPTWDLSPASSKESTAITEFRMLVMPGLQGFDKFSPGYSQSIIRYQFFQGEIRAPFTEMTGLIENAKNIWFHPPRTMLFRILEINPYPFIVFTGEKEWSWNLEIGSSWGDDRWKSWDGLVKNQMGYRDSGMEVISTSFGELSCQKIEAVGVLPWGKTGLVSYFLRIMDS